MLKYAYPRRGFFTCSDKCRYEFDADKEPEIEFGSSPQCNLSSRIFRQTDTLSAVTSLGCGVIGVFSLFTPLAPVVLVASAIGGSSSAVYGTARAVNRLVDKGQHSENLADLESMMLYFSIAATPLNLTTSIMNANLVRGAQVNGRIFSSSTRMFATILNFSTLGVDTVLVGLGIANLIDKANNRQLTTLDVVQFSMSLFFFTNTLIRPQMASKIIAKAQEQHIQNIANTMTDKETRASFDKFISDNKGTGSIKDTSKIVRAINKIDNPDAVFAGLKGADKVMIGGRKGKTLLVESDHRTARVNANKVIFETQTPRPQFDKAVKLNKECFDGMEEEIVVNGKKIFKKLNNTQKNRMNRVFKEAAQKKKEVFDLAVEVAGSLGCDNEEQFLSVVEIIGADDRIKNSDGNISGGIGEIRGDYDNYVDMIKEDLKTATKIAENRGLNFKDQYKAVSHYRKHGQEFPSKINAPSVEIYLNEVPNKLIKDHHLVKMTKNADGTTTKIYNTIDDKFAVVVQGKKETISTIHQRIESFKKVQDVLSQRNKGYAPPQSLDPIFKCISRSMGFRGCPVNRVRLILENGEEVEIKQKSSTKKE